VFSRRDFSSRDVREVSIILFAIRKRRTLLRARFAFRVKEKRADFERKKEEKKEF